MRGRGKAAAAVCQPVPKIPPASASSGAAAFRGGQVIDRLHELGLQYSEQQAASIFVQVAQAVAHLHEYNVLHRCVARGGSGAPGCQRVERFGAQAAAAQPVAAAPLGMPCWRGACRRAATRCSTARAVGQRRRDPRMPAAPALPPLAAPRQLPTTACSH